MQDFEIRKTSFQSNTSANNKLVEKKMIPSISVDPCSKNEDPNHEVKSRSPSRSTEKKTESPPRDISEASIDDITEAAFTLTYVLPYIDRKVETELVRTGDNKAEVKIRVSDNTEHALSLEFNGAGSPKSLHKGESSKFEDHNSAFPGVCKVRNTAIIEQKTDYSLTNEVRPQQSEMSTRLPNLEINRTDKNKSSTVSPDKCKLRNRYYTGHPKQRKLSEVSNNRKEKVTDENSRGLPLNSSNTKQILGEGKSHLVSNDRNIFQDFQSHFGSTTGPVQTAPSRNVSASNISKHSRRSRPIQSEDEDNVDEKCIFRVVSNLKQLPTEPTNNLRQSRLESIRRPTSKAAEICSTASKPQSLNHENGGLRRMSKSETRRIRNRRNYSLAGEGNDDVDVIGNDSDFMDTSESEEYIPENEKVERTKEAVVISNKPKSNKRRGGARSPKSNIRRRRIESSNSVSEIMAWASAETCDGHIFHPEVGYLVHPSYFNDKRGRSRLCTYGRRCSHRPACRDIRVLMASRAYMENREHLSYRDIEAVWGVSRSTVQRKTSFLKTLPKSKRDELYHQIGWTEKTVSERKNW